MILGSGKFQSNNPNFATVDRLIPNLGYVKGNLVLCGRLVNGCMQDVLFEDYIEHCQFFVDNANTIREKLKLI